MLSSKDVGSAVLVSRGASYLTVQMAVTAVAQVLSFAILARIITQSEVGILAILSLITSLSQAVNGAALQQASMKYIGEYAGSDEGLAVGVFYQTLRVSMIISIPIAGFIFIESGLLAQVLLGSLAQAQLIRVLAVDVLVFAGVLPVTNGAVLGAKRFKAAAAIGAIGAVFRQCLIILLILFMKDFIGLVYAWVLSDLAMFAGFGLYTVHVLGLAKRPFPLRELASFSWPLGVGNLVGFVYNWFDRAILIAFVSLASLGIYNAALYAFGVLASLSGAFGNTLLPVYSSITRDGGLDACRRATRLASRYVSLVTVPLALGLLATAKPALTLFVGGSYVGGVVPVMVLSLAFALTVFGLALGPMLTALAETRAIMCITGASSLLGIVSAYVLLPFLGIVGASVARGIATVASLALTIFVLERMNAIGIDVEMAWKSLAAGAVMAAVLIAAQMAVYSKFFFPAYVLLGGLVYMILLRALKAVTKHDIELIKRYLGARLSFVARLLGVILVAGERFTQTD